MDNITDWCLEQFQAKYGDHVTKDDIWEYLYGVMHAPDWREKFRHDLQRNLPRVPLADDFEAFRAAGRELMDLHVGYENCEELPIRCLVGSTGDGEFSEGEHPPESYRINGKMKWGRIKVGNKWQDVKSVLQVNDNCRLIDIPPICHEYTVSGRSPLEWAVTTLVFKSDKDSGITDDPNKWHIWADEPFKLIRHLRRLAHIGKRSAEIIAALPPSLDSDNPSTAAPASAGKAMSK